MDDSEPLEAREHLGSGRASPASGPSASSEEDLGNVSGVERQCRLSIPPSNVLASNKGNKEPWSPIKKEAASLDHACTVDASAGWQSSGGPDGSWPMRPPSPVKNNRGRYERAPTPPAIKKNGSTMSLKGLIASALGRKGG